jgi:glycosyltransferase involved in cell wall biosynthesis
MRIVNSVLGDATGGRWRVVCDYSRVLAGHGHEVLLLVGRKQRDLSAVPAGLRVERIRNRGHYDFPAAWVTARRLRTFEPDIAIAHCSRSVALLRRALGGTAPVVAVSHSNKVRRLLPADAYLALTAYIRDRLESGHRRGEPARPCFVVPNMIPLDERAALPGRRLRRPPRIVALGRFDPVKGLDLFVRALGRLRRQGFEFTAVLGGTGSGERHLKRLAARLDLQQQLCFTGWVEEPMAFLSEADLLCVPARSDAFGLTPLQGAMAGVPMVLSTAAGHRAMFEPEREALFFKTADNHALARQMVRLIDDPRLAEALRTAAFDRVRRCYSAEAVTPLLLHAVENIHENFHRQINHQS